MLKKIMALSLLILSVSVHSAETEKLIKWNYKDADLLDLIEIYSKATSTQFIVDSTVRGKVSNFSSQPMTTTEAFNFLSRSLAINGFTWIKVKDKYIIRNARSAQRDDVETFKGAPTVEPEHMATMIIVLKNTKAATLKKQLGRLLNSSYGEIESYDSKNVLIISDFTSSLNRIYNMITELDALPTKFAEKDMREEPPQPLIKPKTE